MFTVTHDAVFISGQPRQVRATVISIGALYIYTLGKNTHVLHNNINLDI